MRAYCGNRDNGNNVRLEYSRIWTDGELRIKLQFELRQVELRNAKLIRIELDLSLARFASLSALQISPVKRYKFRRPSDTNFINEPLLLDCYQPIDRSIDIHKLKSILSLSISLVRCWSRVVTWRVNYGAYTIIIIIILVGQVRSTDGALATFSSALASRQLAIIFYYLFIIILPDRTWLATWVTQESQRKLWHWAWDCAH